MKAYISVDVEGMPFIVSRDHLSPGRPLFEESRRITTSLVTTVVEELHRQGFAEVIVADSHGGMVNLDVEKFPVYVEVIRGFPRPISMVTAVEEADAVLFLGYHAKAGTQEATFDHTYSGRVIRSVSINGVEASEFLLNAYVAGHYGKPVILVAGDEALLESDVNRYAPWVVKVPLKKSLGRYSARSPSLEKTVAMLKNGAAEAVQKFKAGETKKLVVNEPVELRITFCSTAYADVACLTPGVRRLLPLVVKYTAKNIIEAYGLMELWVLASIALEK
ncbi:MAG: M55 family metallopeptidase [Thermofilaceae archaeon]